MENKITAQCFLRVSTYSPAWRHTSWGFLCSCCSRWPSSGETPGGHGSCGGAEQLKVEFFLGSTDFSLAVYPQTQGWSHWFNTHLSSVCTPESRLRRHFQLKKTCTKLQLVQANSESAFVQYHKVISVSAAFAFSFLHNYQNTPWIHHESDMTTISPLLDNEGHGYSLNLCTENTSIFLI